MPEISKEFKHSWFMKPITNHVPCWVGTPYDVYQYVTSERALDAQNELRSMSDEKIQRNYKGRNFHWVTPAGVFSYASDDKVVTYSGLVCMDIDYLCQPSEIDEEHGDPVTELKEKLLNDPRFDTVLLFRSPRGRGLKWWIPTDLEFGYREYFTAVRNYLTAAYHLTNEQVDANCINESRGCFLGHDAHCYLKPELFKLHL